MSADPPRPLGGVALHNPQLLSPAELEQDFVARRVELDRLLQDLRGQSGRTPQHHLLLGHRGMGKTTLLHRLAHAVAADEELSRAYLPLVFPEEQYNVARLSDLWLNCLDALSDRLEALGNRAAADALDAIVDGLHGHDDDAEVERRALDALVGQARSLGRRLVLLLDNLDLVLDRVGDDKQWALRDALERGDLVVIGASAVAMEATYDYGRAFYDFFRVHRLGPLTAAEVRDVLLALALRHGNERVARIAREQPARLEALGVLAGGNPRTIVTLYSVLGAGADGDVRSDLEALLDRHTPLYKARFEALAPQAQQVVDALCLAWDPATARQLADHTRLDVTSVSSQLNRLEKEGLVEKVRAVDAETGKARGRHAFQVVERFFNIWYLMRASRRVRRKLAWFVSFLELLYGSAGVIEHARKLLGEVIDAGGAERIADLALALTDRVDDALLRAALVHTALDAAEARGVLLVADADDDVRSAERERAERKAGLARLDEALAKVPEPERGELRARLLGLVCVPLQQKVAFVGMPIVSLFEAFEPIFIDEDDRAVVAPLLARGASWTDEDLLGRLSAARGPEAPNRLIDDLGACVMAVRAVLASAGVAVPGLAAAEAVREWARGGSPLRRATLGCAQALDGDLAGAQQTLLALLEAEAELDPRAFLLVNLALGPITRAGGASAFVEALDAAGLSDRYRPLREALHGLASGPEPALDGLAPEIATAAKQQLREIRGSPPPPPDPA